MINSRLSYPLETYFQPLKYATLHLLHPLVYWGHPNCTDWPFKTNTFVKRCSHPNSDISQTSLKLIHLLRVALIPIVTYPKLLETNTFVKCCRQFLKVILTYSLYHLILRQTLYHKFKLKQRRPLDRVSHWKHGSRV